MKNTLGKNKKAGLLANKTFNFFSVRDRISYNNSINLDAPILQPEPLNKEDTPLLASDSNIYIAISHILEITSSNTEEAIHILSHSTVLYQA